MVFDGGIAPSEVFGMDEETLMEADEALNLYIDKLNKGRKGGGKRG